MNPASISLKELVTDITFRPYLQQGTVWQFWYMGAYGLVILLFPLVHKLISGSFRRLVLLWSLLAAVSASVQLASVIAGEPVQGHVIQTFRLWTWMQYFLGGGVISYFSKRYSYKRLTITGHFLILCVWTALTVLWQQHMNNHVLHSILTEYVYDSPIEIAWVLLLTTFVIRLRIGANARKVIGTLSSLTAGVYAVHLYVYSLCGRFYPVDCWAGMLLYYAPVLALSFGLSYVIARFPAGKYLMVL